MRRMYFCTLVVGDTIYKKSELPIAALVQTKIVVVFSYLKFGSFSHFFDLATGALDNVGRCFTGLIRRFVVFFNY